jgi:hypothetical protein
MIKEATQLQSQVAAANESSSSQIHVANAIVRRRHTSQCQWQHIAWSKADTKPELGEQMIRIIITSIL